MFRNKGFLNLITILFVAFFINLMHVKDSKAASHEFSHMESDIRKDYIKSFSDLKEIVIINYESSWWKPSKDAIIKKIDDFISEIKTKNLIEYSVDDINQLSSNIDNLRLLLSYKCKQALDDIKFTLDIIGIKAKDFLLAHV